MRRRWLVIGLLAVIPAAQAMAGVVVMGRGTGRDCYLATLTAPSPDADQHALKVCDQAVADAGLDSYARAASLINRADVAGRGVHHRLVRFMQPRAAALCRSAPA